MKAKDIIEEYWDYDVDYYDEYEERISYISHCDETAIELNLESDNITKTSHTLNGIRTSKIQYFS